ncbi:hypothetical protein WANG_1083 [Lactobacillus kefiranofaciens subsp. kefiranofaciens]|nr:hypothetical protein WANG_1083 [Lactobacillus kefiranofaciens subsp. kefiranofaciens]
MLDYFVVYFIVYCLLINRIEGLGTSLKLFFFRRKLPM